MTRLRSRRGQSMLEVAAALGALMVMGVGAAKMWGWFNTTLVERQQEYQRWRVDAGTFRPLDDRPEFQYLDANPTEPEVFAMGMSLQYTPPPLQILTPSAKDPNTNMIPGEPPPDCREGRLLLDEVTLLSQAAEEKIQRAEAIRQTVYEQHGRAAARASQAYQYHCQDKQEMEKLACDMTFKVMDDDFLEADPRINKGDLSVFNPKYRFKCAAGFSFLPKELQACKAMEEYLQELSDRMEAGNRPAVNLERQAQQLMEQADALSRQAYAACEGKGL